MGVTVEFNRTPRVLEPLPQEEIRLPAPPAISPPPRFNWYQALFPVAGALLMIGGYIFINSLSQNNYNWVYSLLMLPMSLLSALGGILGTRAQRQQHRREQEQKERAYQQAIQQYAERLRQVQLIQQRIRHDKDPGIDVLLERAKRRDRRLWERRPTDEDFLHLRIGIGTLPSTVTITAPHPEVPDPRFQPVLNLEASYRWVPNVPITVDLKAGPLGIAGPIALRNPLARALMAHLAVHHSPDEVHLLAIYSRQRAHEWAWLKWLPHSHVLESSTRLSLANDSASAQEMLNQLMDDLNERYNRLASRRSDPASPDWPWLVLLVEDETLAAHHPALQMLLSMESQNLHATAIFLSDRHATLPQGCATIAEVIPPDTVQIRRVGVAAEALAGKMDRSTPEDSETLARILAPLRVFSAESAVALPTNIRLLDILGIRDIQQYNVQQKWKSRSSGELLKATLGIRRGGQPLILDLSHTGHGPHGLVAGTTGSGKSELLQTLVISLALTHHPYDLGFILVDFKGGGAFSPLVSLPHVLGLITNISGNLAERALVALESEIKRREHLLVNEAKVSDIGRYQDLYWQGKVQEPLPRVVIIVDEFAELVTDYPEFMNGLIRVARVGRALGIHLILATQSPRGKVSQQIWANARFRICLRVEDVAESQDMLHRPDAAYLPRMPGRGYLQVGDNEVFELFQVARVASQYRATGDTDTLIGQPSERIVIHRVDSIGRRYELYDSRKFLPAPSQQSTAQTDMEVVAQHLAAAAQRLGLQKLPSPWPEPLPEHIPLPELLQKEGYRGWNGREWSFDDTSIPDPRFCGKCGAPLNPGAQFCGKCGQPVTIRCPQCGAQVRRSARFCPQCGRTVGKPAGPPLPHPPDMPGRPWLGALIGLLDNPARQRQTPWRLDLGDQDGHLIVVGAPASGKEMWLRTLVVALARTHSPDELHFYLVECGGQALRALDGLPHVAGLFTPMDEERLRRMWVRLSDELMARKELCNQKKVDNLGKLRQQDPSNVPPAIIVVITGFSEFRQQFPEEFAVLLRLLREGGNYDIHGIIVGDRAGDIPPAVSSTVARKVALRLADLDEYSVILGMRPKIEKDARIPFGRGWYGRPPLEFQTASPGYKQDEDEQAEELRQLAAEMSRAWGGPRPKPVEVMPECLLLDDLLARIPAPAAAPFSVPLGVESIRLCPAWVDLIDDGPDFVVAGTPQSGKTGLLMTWVLMLASYRSPQEVQFILTAGRRNSLQPLEALPHVLAYARSYRDWQQKGLMQRITAEIHRREELLSDDPSRGNTLPHIVLLWDDYDDFSNAVSGETEIQKGLDLLARRGRDVNLHTIIAGPMPNLGVGFSDPLPKAVRVWRSGFILRPLEPGDQNPMGIRIRPGDIPRMVAGRGFLARHGREEMVQIAWAGDNTTVAQRVADLKAQWEQRGAPPAEWPAETAGAG